MTESNVRIQNLRDFTVQIRNAENAIVGTGIAVTMDGKIVTCAHVVATALGAHPRQANGGEIGVYFPQVRGAEKKDRRAAIAACFPQHDDDVVLLQLLDGPAPLAPEQIARLGTAEGTEDHAFRSYGYGALGQYLAKYVEGKIMGPVEINLPPETCLHCEPIELRTRDICPGISGAAVLDTSDEKNLVVGVISARWNPQGQSENDNLGWAVNARVLSLAPLGLALQAEPLPKQAAPQPKTDQEAARQAVAAAPGIVWNNAPPLLPEWVGRTDLLNALTADWRSATCRVTGLIGFGGEGKSSLARHWVEGITHPRPLSLEKRVAQAEKTHPSPAINGRSESSSSLKTAGKARQDASTPFSFESEGLSNQAPPLFSKERRPERITHPQPLSLEKRGAQEESFPSTPSFDERIGGEDELSNQNPPLFSKERGPGGEFPPPDGVFWWGFYTNPGVEEFFEAALNYLSGGRIDPRALPSANIKAQVIGAMLGAGRYLFVLDGLEILQHQEGDQYGLLRSSDLREFLSYFADPKQQSFCLITSRAPVLDLMEYTTYTHRDVTRLSPHDGRDLLRNVGVNGDDKSLDRIVADWDGHALTLSLIGSYLVKEYQGDITHLAEIPPPVADEPRYARVHRVLRRYDEHLTAAERAFLTLFSVFRTPVAESAFTKVFRGERKKPGFSEKPGFYDALAALNDASFAALRQRLLTYRLLHYDPPTQTYTTHPLIRNHYFTLFTAGDRAQAQDAHQQIKAYYLELAGDTPRFPTIDDLRPLIEVVHHACRAGAYDEAEQIQWERIYQSTRRVLVDQLGAWETALALMLEFFPNGESAQVPQVSNPKAKSWILNEAGLCLMSLGDLSRAVLFYERANVIQLGLEDWHNASVTYQNLAELHANLGVLAASADAACEALTLARQVEYKQFECYSLAHQAWAAYLRGGVETAGTAFQQAETLEQETYSAMNIRYLFSLRGIQHADHLRRTGDADYARRVTEANLEICERNHWPDDLSLSHRVLGDLDADSGQHDRAREHYDAALKLARGISKRNVLIEVLLARGRWQARDLHDAAAAFNDLHEALEYAVAGGYRIYEADLRVALAWAHLATLTPNTSLPVIERSRDGRDGRDGRDAGGELEAAKAEATRALQMSTAMGYYWGKLDAEEVLKALE